MKPNNKTSQAPEGGKVQRKGSATVALRSLAGAVDTLAELKLISTEDAKTILEIRAKAVHSFVKTQL